MPPASRVKAASVRDVDVGAVFASETVIGAVGCAGQQGLVHAAQDQSAVIGVNQFHPAFEVDFVEFLRRVADHGLNIPGP